MEPKGLKQEELKRIYSEYSARRPRSRELFERAQEHLPGGDTRTLTYHMPFPTFMHHGNGCRLFDEDGNEYIDFFNNATSLIHGHAHPRVVQAVEQQILKGSAFASPVLSQCELAAIICRRLPSADKIRFCNSGTEATMTAVRAARAYRQRYKVLKMEGGYHGSYDLVEVSIKPKLSDTGPTAAPNAVPEHVAVTPGVLQDCLVAPYNESEPAVDLIEKHREELSAVIVEPMLGSGGMIPANPEFLAALRDATSKHGIPLIFDEVQSFRVAPGGCQELFEVVPDITILGKIIGGGYPIGAVTGNEQIMRLFSPLEPRYLSHSGTFNGNPVSMVAGAATLQELTADEIERINHLGEMLRDRFRRVLRRVGLISRVTGIGSMAQVHFTPEKVAGWRQAVTGRMDLREMTHLLLLNRGIYTSKRVMFNISTPMSEPHVNQAARALEDSLSHIKPYIQRCHPELVLG